MTNALNIDCMKFMEHQPEDSWDLAIVDPPYGTGKQIFKKGGNRTKLAKAKGYKKKDWNENIPEVAYFDELFRVSKHQIIWGGNYFAHLLPRSDAWIVWDKVNMETDYSDCELAWTSFKGRIRQIEFMWNGMMQGRSLKNGRVQQADKSKNEKRIHACQKPVKLYEWILDTYAQPGWKILDTHLGSGSIRIACHEKDFDFFGCEIDKEMYDKQQKRFFEHTSQLTIK